jgi:hypothetical protein
VTSSNFKRFLVEIIATDIPSAFSHVVDQLTIRATDVVESSMADAMILEQIGE